MGRRNLTVRDITEILIHGQAGRSLADTDLHVQRA